MRNTLSISKLAPIAGRAGVSLGLPAAIMALALTTSASAQDSAAGRWAVAGNVDGKNFTLDCRFQQSGAALSGACIDGPTGDSKIKGGRSHALTKGHATGTSVSWTYVSSYMILSFNVDYAGVRNGDHMSGTIAAAGKKGAFTARRVSA